MPEPDFALITAQAKLGKSLALGFVLSLFPMFGVASLVIGIRALRAIRLSGGKLTGRKMTYWCLIVGGIDTGICAYGITGLVVLFLLRA